MIEGWKHFQDFLCIIPPANLHPMDKSSMVVGRGWVEEQYIFKLSKTVPVLAILFYSLQGGVTLFIRAYAMDCPTCSLV